MPFESKRQPIAPRAPRPNPDAGDRAALQDVVPNVRGGPGLNKHIAELWSEGIEVNDDNEPLDETMTTNPSTRVMAPHPS